MRRARAAFGTDAIGRRFFASLSSKRFGRFADHRTGAAMVEFALVLPVMLLIYMHLVDYSRAFNERRRVVRLSGTLADLVSQQSTTKPILTDTVSSMFDVASAVMTPYPTENVKMTVSVIDLTPRADRSCCDAKVRWTVTQGGTMRPCGTLLKLVGSTVPPAPDNMLAGMVNALSLGTAPSTQIVVADVQDAYQPMFSALSSFFLGGFQKTAYSFPRGSGELLLQPALLGSQQRICY